MQQMCRIRARVINSEVAVVEVSGRLDPGFERDGIYRTVEKLLSDGQKKIVLDLSRVTFVTSLGVGTLINILRLITREGGELKLLKPSLSVQKILSVSNLDRLFEMYPTEEEALQSFLGGSASPRPKHTRRRKENG